MTLVLFRRKSREWCLQALDWLEEQQANGLTSSSSPSHGAASFSNLEEAIFKINQLNMRIDQIDRAAGLDVPDTNQVIVKALWGRRSWR